MIADGCTDRRSPRTAPDHGAADRARLVANASIAVTLTGDAAAWAVATVLGCRGAGSRDRGRGTGRRAAPARIDQVITVLFNGATRACRPPARSASAPMILIPLFCWVSVSPLD